MVLHYVSRQVVIAVLPKKLVKSLRYTTILCSLIVQHSFLKDTALIQEILLTKKANFAAKMAKNVEFRRHCTPQFRHKNR
jgi:hypothetical protein